MPSDLWRWQVDVERVADLSAVIDWLRLVLRHLSRPSGSGHPAFQASWLSGLFPRFGSGPRQATDLLVSVL